MDNQQLQHLAAILAPAIYTDSPTFMQQCVTGLSLILIGFSLSLIISLSIIVATNTGSVIGTTINKAAKLLRVLRNGR
jgi:hypothetical protein